MAKLYTMLGAFACLMAVILGAFAAHGLKSKLDSALLSTFQTGVQYQMYHGLALLLVALYIRNHSVAALIASGAFLTVGIVLFSGSLYWLAFGGPRWLGPVTPIGGMCFIVGWSALLIAAFKS